MRLNLSYLFLWSLLGCHLGTGNNRFERISKLPSFKILSINSNTCINSESIHTGQPTVFIYFDPTCEHCQHETEGIIANILNLKQARIYLIANDTSNTVDSFYATNRLDTIKNIFVGKDYNYSFYRVFLPQAVPYIAIYNAKNKLVKLYSGEANIKYIIDATRD